MGGKKLPWFKFFPDDWLSDEKLRGCSGAALGLWIDMLCLMHKNDRRGYLQVGGKPATATRLARMTGRTTGEVSRLLAELLNSGVASATEHGIVYSRRMVGDEHKRRLCSEAGRRGRGSPLLAGTFKGVSKGAPKGPFKGASDSDSLESDSSLKGGGGRGRGPPALAAEDVDLSAPGLAQRWCFLCARRKLGVPKDLPSDIAEEMAELLRLGHPAEALRDAILDEKRDRGEYFWQFKERLTGRGARPKPETPQERVRRLNAGKEA